MKLIELSRMALIVAIASSSDTLYPNVSAIFPIGAQPIAIGGAMRSVLPNALFASTSFCDLATIEILSTRWTDRVLTRSWRDTPDCRFELIDARMCGHE